MRLPDVDLVLRELFELTELFERPDFFDLPDAFEDLLVLLREPLELVREAVATLTERAFEVALCPDKFSRVKADMELFA